MKPFSSILKNTLCFAIGIMTLSLSGQTIITIDNNPGSTTTHQTLQDALDDITTNNIADAVIYVQPSGTTYGNGVIDSPVTIVGRSHSEPGKKSIVGTINPRSSNITLKGLQVGQFYPQSITGGPVQPPFSGLNIFECEMTSTFQIGTVASLVTTNFSDIAVRGNVIQSSMYIYGDTDNTLISNNIFTSSTPFFCYNASSTVIANNIFKYWSTAINLYNQTPSVTLLLFNNMFIFHIAGSTNGQVNFQTGDFNLTNNLTYNYGPGDVTIGESGGGTYLDSFTLANTNPLFTNVDPTVLQSFADNSSYNPSNRVEDDLTLQGGSPALTGGGGGSQMGLYNNDFLYKMLGNPRDIPTIDVISYDGAVEKDGNINVTINAKAH